ncbi:MAG: hypothetical protein MR694_01695, partial [Spirochaetia bacterium]|nr:hypothetical protein [Spirochaetia bacterium]
VPKRSEGMKALLRWNPEKREFAMQTRDEKMLCISRFFCEAKSHPKNKNSKLDICPTRYLLIRHYENLFCKPQVFNAKQRNYKI